MAVLLSLLVAGVAWAGGSPAEDVPIGSWVYDAVFELSTRGHFADLLLHTRPFTRGELAAAVEGIGAEDRQLSVGEAILLARLRSEFAEELRNQDPIDQEKTHSLRLGGGPNARIDQIRHGAARNRVGLDLTGSFGAGEVLAIRTRVRFDSDARHDSQFHGEYWKENFTAWMDQAVITVQYRGFRGAFGREFWRWGRSPVDAMLISDQSPPFDGLRLAYRARTWSFSFHATMLDSMSDELTGTTNRYLVGHRLDWKPRKNIEIAISEVVLFGGANRPWALNYLNPFVPYYWEQLNNDTNDNPLWNVEWSWRFPNHLEVYGEWLIDDFQIDFTSEPQQIGILLGAVWTGGPDGRAFINAEYERINTFVYGQSRPHNRYFHFRDLSGNPIGIGSNLGTDADRIVVRPRWHCTAKLDLTGHCEYVRRGGNRMDSPQAGAVPKHIPFPSGVVERRTTAGLGAHAQLGGHAILDMLMGYERVVNVGNADSVSRDGILFQVRLAGSVWKTMGI